MDKYVQEKILGKGAFGSAWLVRRKTDKQQFVAKEVRLAGLKPAERASAQHEVSMLRKLDHPNVTRYVDHFDSRGNLYIIMEYANGGDLYSKIKARKGKRLSEKEILHYFTQLCLALLYMHSKRILHRDLKSQNVFLTTDGVVKLGDFGISTVLRNTMETKRTVCGTPYYFSPELCMNKPYNNKSDVWALGCILYELTTLTHAFDGNSMKALVQKILRGVYPPIDKSYSADLGKLVGAMLKLDPKSRPNVHDVVAMPYVRNHLISMSADVSRANNKDGKAAGGNAGEAASAASAAAGSDRASAATPSPQAAASPAAAAPASSPADKGAVQRDKEDMVARHAGEARAKAQKELAEQKAKLQQEAEAKARQHKRELEAEKEAEHAQRLRDRAKVELRQQREAAEAAAAQKAHEQEVAKQQQQRYRELKQRAAEREARDRERAEEARKARAEEARQAQADAEHRAQERRAAQAAEDAERKAAREAREARNREQAKYNKERALRQKKLNQEKEDEWNRNMAALENQKKEEEEAYQQKREAAIRGGGGGGGYGGEHGGGAPVPRSPVSPSDYEKASRAAYFDQRRAAEANRRRAEEAEREGDGYIRRDSAQRRTPSSSPPSRPQSRPPSRSGTPLHHQQPQAPYQQQRHAYPAEDDHHNRTPVKKAFTEEELAAQRAEAFYQRRRETEANKRRVLGLEPLEPEVPPPAPAAAAGRPPVAQRQRGSQQGTPVRNSPAREARDQPFKMMWHPVPEDVRARQRTPSTPSRSSTPMTPTDPYQQQRKQSDLRHQDQQQQQQQQLYRVGSNTPPTPPSFESGTPEDGTDDEEEAYAKFLRHAAGGHAGAGQAGYEDNDNNYESEAIGNAINAALLDDNQNHEDEDFEDTADVNGSLDPNQMLWDGQQLNMPGGSGSSSSHPLMSRVESLRSRLEAVLGDEKFLQAYNIMDGITSADDQDTLLPVLELLPVEHHGYIPVIAQLLVCEDNINRTDNVA